VLSGKCCKDFSKTFPKNAKYILYYISQMSISNKKKLFECTISLWRKKIIFFIIVPMANYVRESYSPKIVCFNNTRVICVWRFFFSSENRVSSFRTNFGSRIQSSVTEFGCLRTDKYTCICTSMYLQSLKPKLSRSYV